MQNSLTTIKDVKDWVETNEYPYWRLFSGYLNAQNQYVISSNMTNGNMTESLSRLESALLKYSNEYGGAFNILCNKEGNPKDNSGFRSNVTLSGGQSQQMMRMAGIGNIENTEGVEARIAKEVKRAVDEVKKEYEHKAMIQGLKDEIELIKEDRKSEWSFERVNGIVDTLLQNPILQAVVMKATGLGAIPTQVVTGENRTDDSEVVTENDEKIDLAAETLEKAGFTNSGDILLAVAKYVRANPTEAMAMFNSIQNQQG